MPTIKSAEKKLRQSRKRREHNKSIRSEIRTHEKKVREAESPEEAEAALKDAYAVLDRAAGKGVIHPNKADRKKSQLASHVDSLS